MLINKVQFQFSDVVLLHYATLQTLQTDDSICPSKAVFSLLTPAFLKLLD